MPLLFWRRKQELTRPSMVIVGLGNPGLAYAYTRHNVGFMCIDHFARDHDIPWTDKKGPLRWCGGQIPLSNSPVEIMLAKPRTFMNHSGEAVKYLVDRWRMDISNILVIHDDMDLPLGKIRVRPRGSSGGHKGIQSIIDTLGTQEIPRIRVGIGQGDSEEIDVIDYVLSEFTEEEEQVLEGVVAAVSEATLCILAEGVEAAMNKFN